MKNQTLVRVKPDSYTPMHKILSKGKAGNFEIKFKMITKEDVRRAEMRSIFNPSFYPPKVGMTTILCDNGIKSWGDGECVMSDTEFEKVTNRYFNSIADGSVLIGGLGLGMIILPLLKRNSVTKITVIEKHPEIIKLVWNQIKRYDNKNKLELINDSIFDVELPEGSKYDVIYMDIWNNVCGDNWEQMKNLKKKFRKHRAVGSKILCWEEDYTKRLDRE